MALEEDKVSKSEESAAINTHSQEDKPKDKPQKEAVTIVKALPTDPRLNPRNWPNFDVNKVCRELLMIIPPRVRYFTIVWDDVPGVPLPKK